MRATDGKQAPFIATEVKVHPQQQIPNNLAVPVPANVPVMLQIQTQPSPLFATTAQGQIFPSDEPRIRSEENSTSSASTTEQSLPQQMEQAIVNLNSVVIHSLLEKGMAPLDIVPESGLTVVELGMIWLRTDRAALLALLERIPPAQRNAMAGKLYSAANTRGNALAFECLLQLGVPVNNKTLNGILTCVQKLVSLGQTQAVKTYLRIYQRYRPDEPPDLGNALLAAAHSGQAACLEVLLEFFDIRDDVHYKQLCSALEAAANANSVPAAIALIDWLKVRDAFDEENIFPIEESLPSLPDQALFCLAKAGYLFSP